MKRFRLFGNSNEFLPHMMLMKIQEGYHQGPYTEAIAQRQALRIMICD